MADTARVSSGGQAQTAMPAAAMAWLMLAPAILLMAVFYFYPLLRVLLISVAEPTPGLGNYAVVVDSASVHRVLLTTARVCGLTTVIAVMLGYIVAYAMTVTSRSGQRLIMAFVVLPLWISALVRAFAWVVLLRREGLINETLRALDITDAPISLVSQHPRRRHRHGALYVAICNSSALREYARYRSTLCHGRAWPWRVPRPGVPTRIPAA